MIAAYKIVPDEIDEIKVFNLFTYVYIYLMYLCMYSTCVHFDCLNCIDYLYNLSMCINRRLWWIGAMKRNLTSS